MAWCEDQDANDCSCTEHMPPDRDVVDDREKMPTENVKYRHYDHENDE